MPFDTRSAKKIVTFSDFEKFQRFFEKKPSIFSKQISFVLRNLITLVASTAHVLQFSEKFLTFRNVNEHHERKWQISGKKMPSERKIFLPCFINMAENKN